MPSLGKCLCIEIHVNLQESCFCLKAFCFAYFLYWVIVCYFFYVCNGTPPASTCGPVPLQYCLHVYRSITASDNSHYICHHICLLYQIFQNVLMVVGKLLIHQGVACGMLMLIIETRLSCIFEYIFILHVSFYILYVF